MKSNNQPKLTIDLEMTLRPDAPAAVAGAAIRALSINAGLSAERSTRLQTLVEQIILEIRLRECIDGAEDIYIQVAHGSGYIQIEFQDHRLPLSIKSMAHSEAKHIANLGFADSLLIRNGGPEGNFLICKAHLHDHDVDILNGESVIPEDFPVISENDIQLVKIREMTPADANDLIKCVYRCYGYSYPNILMYQSKHIQRVLTNQIMYSVVATTPKNEVVGHCSLTFNDHGGRVPEAGKMIVDPRYRGNHLADMLANKRKMIAKELGLVGFWSECVTNHPYSQHEIINSGGAETGLFIGVVPASMQMQNLNNINNSRYSLLAFYTALTKQSVQKVYLPERHIDFFKGLLSATALRREVITNLTSSHLKSHYSVEISKKSECAHFHVTTLGDDFIEKLNHELHAIQNLNHAFFYVDIPINQPIAAMIIYKLEALHFFWGAWLPEFNLQGDILRLQRINYRVDSTNIICARKEGELVRDHILQEMKRISGS